MKKNLYVLISFFYFLSLKSYGNFTELWHEMQTRYINLNNALEKSKLFHADSIAIHPYWQLTQSKIKQMILEEANPNFLDFPPIAGTMVRQGMGIPQSYEILYLKYCINSELHEKISRVEESSISKLKNECLEYNCSVNTLGHLFIAAKTLETLRKKPDIIVEFGAGYGNLAYVLKQIHPGITLFLIDLPELLAIQFLFLKSSFPNSQIDILSSPAETYEPGSINLIPIQILPNFTIQADAFISTMALSESTVWTQEQIINKKFFNAKTIYITGQINGWGSGYGFLNHSFMVNEVKKCYGQAILQPLHFILEGLYSYELIA